MKRMYFMMAIAAATSIATNAMAQRVEMMEGNFDALKGVRKMNVKYDYSEMEVGKKKEKDFVADKTETYNGKEPGKGDKWAKDWVADREARFEPRLEDEFNKMGDIKIGHYPNEKYTLIFKTVYTEPGFNVGVMRKNAYIDGQAWIVETSNPDKAIVKLEINNCPGRTFMGMDYDTGERIQEAYAMAGKGLARYFGKKID